MLLLPDQYSWGSSRSASSACTRATSRHACHFVVVVTTATIVIITLSIKLAELSVCFIRPHAGYREIPLRRLCKAADLESSGRFHGMHTGYTTSRCRWTRLRPPPPTAGARLPAPCAERWCRRRRRRRRNRRRNRRRRCAGAPGIAASAPSCAASAKTDKIQREGDNNKNNNNNNNNNNKMKLKI